MNREYHEVLEKLKSIEMPVHIRLAPDHILHQVARLLSGDDEKDEPQQTGRVDAGFIDLVSEKYN